MSVDKELLNMSVDELDLEIGRALLGGELGSKDISDRELRTTARRWLESNLVNFRDTICNNEIVQQQLMADESKSRNELFTAVADALMKMSGIAVPFTTLAARLIHYGLNKICTAPIK